MLDTIKRLVREEEGQGMAEYALILVAVAIVCIVAFQTVGKTISDKMGEVNTELQHTEGSGD